MAHNIMQLDVQEGLAQAWHGLTQINTDLSLDNNILTKWDLVETPLCFENGEKCGFSILKCSDVNHIIGVPYNPETFKPISNANFIQLVRDSISGTKHKVTSVGSVRNRGRVFISIALNGMEEFTAAGKHFSAYLNFGNGHDKSSVIWANTSNTCTVCDNTFSANLFSVETNKQSASDDIRARMRHTKLAVLKLPALAALIDKAVGVQGEFAIAMDKLAKIPVSRPEPLFAGFLARDVVDTSKGLATRTLNTTSRLVELFKQGAGNRGESLADAFSAVTDYYSHESSGKDNRLKQLVSSDHGAGQSAKSDFWKIVNSGDKVADTIEHGQKLLVAS
jgi:hypothetical protein